MSEERPEFLRRVNNGFAGGRIRSSRKTNLVDLFWGYKISANIEILQYWNFAKSVSE